MRVTYRIAPQINGTGCLTEAERVLECFMCFLPIRHHETCFRAESGRSYHLECAVTGQAVIRRKYPQEAPNATTIAPSPEAGQRMSRPSR